MSYTSGYASWSAKDIIFGADELGYGGGVGGLSRPLPSGLPKTVGYAGQCRSDFRPVSFDGFTGWYAPQGVGWLWTITERADANRHWQEIANFATFSECSWPALTMVINTCPLSAQDVFSHGPTGMGLPVQSGNGSFIPASVNHTDPVGTASGARTVYSDIGRAVLGGSFAGLPSSQQASLIANCKVDLSAQFRYSPQYFGNYNLAGPGTRAKCSYLEFVGMRKVIGCHGRENFNFKFRSYLACDGMLYGGTADLNYDFSCKKPTETCIENGPCPVVNPPPTCDGPCDPGTSVRCTYAKPITTTPQGLKIPTMNGVATVSANGQGYHIDWGVMTTIGSPAITNQWTDFYISQSSSPGNIKLHANDKTQPFSGTVDGRPSLMWDNVPSDLNHGIIGPWKTGIDIHFYQASASGKTFTLWQERSYSWTKTIPSQNWDGSITPISFPITETCPSVPAVFTVVTSRNSGG